MKYGSVCSGIEAASVAWHDLGWEPQWFSEIEQFPSEVLKHRFPDVPNLGDMTQLTQNPTFNERSIDLLVGGTPCQSFSVAGLRKGLADPRGNLMLTFLALADAKKPKWIVWENVPGVLSSNGGRDFGTFLGALGELGYGFAFRTLNAEYFGVPQRRRRVFVVGYLGDWRVAAAVLFERESLQGNTKPSRKKREEVTANAEGSIGEAGDAQPIAIQDVRPIEKAQNGRGWNDDGTSYTVDTKATQGVAQPIAFKIRGGCEGGGKGYLGQEEQAFTISTMQDQQIAQPIAVDFYNQCITGDTFQTVSTRINASTTGGVMHSMAIRRLTPKECERLQGFPDDWTKIPYRNKEADQCPDGPRYKACGNSMAVPVMRWIGKRINLIESIL
jgi:DNA (cytosine-5)-methyltransferase 1